KDLYKDEVRQLGEELGLPHELVWRHPFPGPGLGVRILCAEHAESTESIALQADVPTAVLPVRSVGVQGDGRTYRHAAAVFPARPFESYPEYVQMAVTVPNTNPQINRVLVCVSHTDVPEFSFTPGYITRDRADLLREADAVVNQ